ncbi:extracellular solute-binding protein [Rhizobium terrae]|uniref:extracellular solute-binding protein n=1 Tax=Rhizobium terrae TaxID=2171756 RepID=UPI0013C30FB5|nr:extracellular solute-binding protein [Rhizobium terrae]
MQINRRNFIAAPLALGASSLVSKYASAQGKLEDTLIIRTAGGEEEKLMIEYFFKPFSKETGVNVIPVSSSYGEMVTKVKAMFAAKRIEWDIVLHQQSDIVLPANQDIIVDLGKKCEALPNVASQNIPGACLQYGVPYNYAALVLTYNTKHFGANLPKTYADFWDVQKFPGARGMNNDGSPWRNIMGALLADGVKPSELFPLDVDRAFRKLNQIKPHVSVWWKVGGQGVEAFKSETVVFSPLYTGQSFFLKRAGLPIDYTWNEGLMNRSGYSILKGAPHPRAAAAFLNFWLSRSDEHGEFMKKAGFLTGYAKEVTPKLSPEEVHALGASAAIQDSLVKYDWDWLEPKKASLINDWNRWLAS